MVRRTQNWLLPVAVGLAMVAAGCFGGADIQDDSDSKAEQGTDAPMMLQAVSERVRVTLPHDGRPDKEFNAHVDPTDRSRIAVGIVGATCDAYLSDDGGASWQDITPPMWAPQMLDPWVQFGPDGDLHMMCMNDDDTHLTHSSDRGATWQDSVRIPESGWDRPVFLAASDGTWYECATYDGGPRVMVSTDRGATWTVADFPRVRAGCDEMVETPQGHVVATYHRFDTLPALGLGVIVTRDGGRSWGYGETILEMWSHLGRNTVCDQFPRPIDRNVNEQLFLGCVVAAAVAPLGMPQGWMLPSWSTDPTTGEIYVAYSTHRNVAQGLGWYEIKIMRSADLGDSWQEVALPPEAAPCADCHVYRPTIVFDSDGNLGLRFKRGTVDIPNDHWFAVRPAGADVWVQSALVDTTSHLPHEYDGGLHYWQTVATDDAFLVFWLDIEESTGQALWAQRYALRPTA